MRLRSHFIGFLLVLIAGAAQASTYENLFAKHFGAGFVVTEGEVIIGDLAYPREKCITQSLSPCIRTERFVFYVPSAFPAIRIWHKDGASYRLKSERKGFWQNTDIRVYVIEQAWRGETLYFAYSIEFGVLAINSASGGQPEQLTLMESCGFAAMPSSRHCANLRMP